MSNNYLMLLVGDILFSFLSFSMMAIQVGLLYFLSSLSSPSAITTFPRSHSTNMPPLQSFDDLHPVITAMTKH